jgi:hypothetical protein
VPNDGTRSVEIRQIAGIQHADDMLMVYLPKEKVLIEADAYTPPAPIDQILLLHGRMVPAAELYKAAGVTP